MKTFFWSVLFLVQLGFAQPVFNVQEVLEYQQQLNDNFKDPDKSPLLPDDLGVFEKLDFYVPNPDFVVVATLERTPDETPFEMKTTTDRVPLYVKYGLLRFRIQGREFTLNLYRNIELSQKTGYEDFLFLPFSDLTSGKQTYIGGRYIDIKAPEANEVIIDFNKAYNPYCAYNYKYSCPIVPLENDLKIEIRAGVKKFHD